MIKKLINKKSNNIWNESVRKLINNELSVEEFANKNAKKTVFYSTPFGEDKNGKPQLWVLKSERSNTVCYPVFFE